MDSNDLEAYGKKCCYFWFHSEVKFLTRFDVFFDLVILAYFNVISIQFYAVKFVICIYFVSKWDKAYIKDLNAWRFLMNFYVFI